MRKIVEDKPTIIDFKRKRKLNYEGELFFT